MVWVGLLLKAFIDRNLRAHDVSELLQIIHAHEVRIVSIASSDVFIDAVNIRGECVDDFLGKCFIIDRRQWPICKKIVSMRIIRGKRAVQTWLIFVQNIHRIHVDIRSWCFTRRGRSSWLLFSILRCIRWQRWSILAGVRADLVTFVVGTSVDDIVRWRPINHRLGSRTGDHDRWIGRCTHFVRVLFLNRKRHGVDRAILSNEGLVWEK